MTISLSIIVFFCIVIIFYLLRRLQQQSKLNESILAKNIDDAQQRLAAERERIYADLHDDLGAKLLQLVYESPSKELADLARASLQDLRDVVSRSRGCVGVLSDALNQIEQEAQARLSSAQIELDWELKQLESDPILDQAQNLHLFRIFRESISNAIRHAHAVKLKIRILGTIKALHIEISDDGVGLSSSTNAGGRGLDNLRHRAEQLAGHITWRDASIGGTRVVLNFPLVQQSFVNNSIAKDTFGKRMS